MFYTVYKITNLINGNVYIGKHQTKDVDDSYMGSGKNISRAVKKYGLENFKKEILFVFDNEQDMNSKEAKIVTEEFCKRDDTYNICPGGQGGFGYINENRLGINIQDQIKRDPSIIHRSRKNAVKTLKNKLENDEEFSLYYKKMRSEIAKTKIGNLNSFYNRNHSEETKKSMSEKAKERLKDPTKNSQYGTMWITNGSENRKIKKSIDIIPEGWYKGRR